MDNFENDFDRMYMIQGNDNVDACNNIKPMLIEIEVEGAKFDFEIDTGSPISAVSNKVMQRSQELSTVKLNETSRKFKTYTGDIIKPLGIMTVNVKYRGKVNKLELFVFPGESIPIIGRDWLNVFDIFKIDGTVNNLRNNQVGSIDKIIENFKEIFSEKLGQFREGKFKLHVKSDCKPVFCKPRPVPHAMRERIEEEIDRLVREKVVEPVESSEWATPVVPVLKSNGKVRLCGDYKITLNPSLVIDRRPIPRVEDFVENVHTILRARQT